MRLKIRKLELSASTAGPEVGASLTFGDGLNILRADNSSGKSTCLQAIIYALGLEGMLSARREIPLPHAMTHAVEVEGREFPINESHVSLEIENSNGEVLTVRRAVTSGRTDRLLAQTWRGPLLTQPGEYPRNDYFVRRAGAAQREAGYQYQLARFIGWDIPRVARMDGSESPLYLEAIFPFIYVEQKHGWSGIQARIPGYLGLREPGKRAVEFLLGLEAYDRILARQRLVSIRSMLEGEWKATAASLRIAGERSGIVLSGLSDRPSLGFAQADVRFHVSVDSEWVILDDEIRRLSVEIAEDRRVEIQTAAERAGASEDALSDAQRLLANDSSLLSATVEELGEAMGRRESIESRIESLEEDRQRHRDLNLLERLGSAHVNFLNSPTQCPTCHQELRDGLEVSDAVMSVAENLDFIEQQLSTFRSMRQDAVRSILALQSREAALRDRVIDLRRSIRAHKQSLIEASSAPAAADLVTRLRREDRHENLVRIRADLGRILQSLHQAANAWAENEARISQLGRDLLSPSDEEKLAALQGTVRTQLRQYGFRSLNADTVEVSRETYRPVHEGFDLGFDLSASDMIRLIWSYLFGLFETGSDDVGSHPRLLIFDEPRQQETARISFERLLTRSAHLNQDRKPVQIIFATSDDEDEIVRMLGSSPHRLISFPSGSKVIRAVEQ